MPEKLLLTHIREGYINWNVHQKVMEKIKSNRNGTWMFEKGSVKIEQGNG
jgi:hypothetical protein